MCEKGAAAEEAHLRKSNYYLSQAIKMELMKATKESNQLYECAEFLNFIARICSVRNSELERAKNDGPFLFGLFRLLTAARLSLNKRIFLRVAQSML